MSFALSSAVTGLQAHQKMLDVAGNNLANVNTAGFKSGYVTFSETLSQTIRSASGPSANLGGINPQQLGSGVQVANVSKKMTQGSISSTGQDLDMAIDGSGFFCLSDGEGEYYTRIGAFAVDSGNFLVDPSTGCRVQRIGSTGEAEGFQTSGISNIQIPYDMAIPPEATSEFSVTGNLRAAGSSTESTATTLKMRLGMAFTTASGDPAPATTRLGDTEQFSGTFSPGDTLDISGITKAGTPISLAPPVLTFDATTEIQDVLNYINTSALNTEITATLENGEIYITANDSGYTKNDIKIEVNSATAELDIPSYFTIEVPGGNDVASTNVTIYDSQGGEHVMSVAFVRTDTPQKWDLVMKSVTGNVASLNDRVIEGIDFTTIGEFDGLDGLDLNGNSFIIDFAHDAGTVQKIDVNLGTKGKLDGVTQFASEGAASTVVADGADGYSEGKLSGVTVDSQGMVVGTFTNGITKDIAAIKIAVFQNPAGLEAIGNGYYQATGNSGTAVGTQAMSNGAGEVKSKSLEKSNVDTAVEFVNLMEAQNGFQANARTIQIANEVLQELTNIIR